MDSLNPYSQRVAARLFAAHPEWRAYARAQSQGEDGDYLVVEISPPAAGRPHLAISTSDEEITVEYDRWHAHFDWWSDDEEEGFFRAIACVHDILSEKTAIAVTMTGDRWEGSRALAIDDTPPMPRHGQLVYVLSWHGSRDAEIRAT